MAEAAGSQAVGITMRWAPATLNKIGLTELKMRFLLFLVGLQSTIPAVPCDLVPQFPQQDLLTEENFKAVLVSHIRSPGALQLLDTFLLSCFPAQFGLSCGRAIQLSGCYDPQPWFKR